MSITPCYAARTSSEESRPASSVHTQKIKARSRSNESSEPGKRRSDERRLVRRAARGDLDAQEELFGRYRSRLYRLALRLLRSKEDAEDAVQDALLSAYRNLGSFQGRSLFSTWLTRIVVNAALVRMRRQRARPELFLEDASNGEHVSAALIFVDGRPDPEQACASAETRDILRDALGNLSPSIRFAFQLRELEDLSNAEAAQVAGIELAAFKSRISRARSQLAERFSPAAIAPLQKTFTTPVIPLRRVLEEGSAVSSAG
jgi:RNA polymerase sigma-70 factor, ECF subfamily